MIISRYRRTAMQHRGGTNLSRMAAIFLFLIILIQVAFSKRQRTFGMARKSALPILRVGGSTSLAHEIPNELWSQRTRSSFLLRDVDGYRAQRAMAVRGGSSSSSGNDGKDIELNVDDGDEAGLIVAKLRNFVRSILSVSDRKSPSLSKVIRSIVSSLESLLGTRLLPKKQTKTKKNGNVKRVKSGQANKKVKAEREDDEKVNKMQDVKGEDEKSSKPKEKKEDVKLTKQVQKHMDAKLDKKSPNLRIQKELKDFIKNPPPNLEVKVGSNIRIWIVTITGREGSIYQGETFLLRIQFPKEYPLVPPSVYFLPEHIPTHEHVYTNGDICLSTLGKGWKPSMTAQSIAISIQSMLNSARSKKLPMDNARHALNKPGQYQKDWVYHDDNC